MEPGGEEAIVSFAGAGGWCGVGSSQTGLGGATYASSTASKWEYRTPTSRFARRKQRPVLSSARRAGLAGGGAFFLANREVREIKNAVSVSCGVLLFDGNRPFDRGHRPMASIREAPCNKERFSKKSLDFLKYFCVFLGKRYNRSR